MRQGSTRARVLDFIQGAGQASIVQVCEAMGAESKAAKQRVWEALKELTKEGRLERVAPAIYTCHDPGPRKKHDVMTRIWRAICASGSEFTSREISDLASASRDHTKKVITWLRQQGYVRIVGKKAVPGVQAKLNAYRVVPEKRGRVVPPYSRPRLRSWNAQWEPLKDTAFEILRGVWDLPAWDTDKLREIEASADALLVKVGTLRGHLLAKKWRKAT